MKGHITALTRKGTWGYVEDESGKEIFFHIANCSKNFKPEIGRVVEYELTRAFRVGQPDQAVNLRYVETETAAQNAQKVGGKAGV